MVVLLLEEEADLIHILAVIPAIPDEVRHIIPSLVEVDVYTAVTGEVAEDVVGIGLMITLLPIYHPLSGMQ
jgi:hypothetical protein